MQGGRVKLSTHWIGLVLAVVASLAALAALTAPARATPVWLTAVNLSDPGGDGFQPQVAVDPNGNTIAVATAGCAGVAAPTTEAMSPLRVV